MAIGLEGPHLTFPTDLVPTPEIVERIAAGRPCEAVWLNELGGLTFRIGPALGPGAEYLKTGPGDFAGEAQRLAWAGRFVTVPRVLGHGPHWLHTAGLPGFSAVDPRWTERPWLAARAAGVGLRVLHDALPAASCPFSWSAERRLAVIAEPHRRALADAPSVDRLVVCHGDACTPNTLMAADGTFCGHVDLGALGVADRWADLAVATMSLDWNYPPSLHSRSWESELLEAYGIEPDALRIDYYRLGRPRRTRRLSSEAQTPAGIGNIRRY